VRHTYTSKRSRDEKRWVSMDVLVNPNLYGHVSEIEAEEMKFDDTYEVGYHPKDDRWRPHHHQDHHHHHHRHHHSSSSSSMMHRTMTSSPPYQS
jgi:G3E family GTPase